MVALVQSASTLPVFFLGLPSGALADILDRRKYFIFTQFWVATVGVLMCLVTLSGHMVAPLLLLLTFANGIGLAMRWPVFSAVIPELIPKAQLPAALALADDGLVPIPTSEYPTPAMRPLNSRLDTGKLRARFGLHLPPWQVGVARMLDEILVR